jgi:hypothetical protein
MRTGQTTTTHPLTWYPTVQGLHWTVNLNVLTNAGPPEATVGWDSLTDLLTERGAEPDTKVRRGPYHQAGIRDGLAAKRGNNIAVVAGARRQLEFVFYALRDG